MADGRQVENQWICPINTKFGNEEANHAQTRDLKNGLVLVTKNK